MIEAALFDMDGLLIDSERVYFQGVQAVAPALGWQITEEMVAKTLGTTNEATDAVFAQGNPGYSGQVLRRELESWLVREGYDRHMPLKPHAKEILEAFTARGIRCGLVTSSPLRSAQAFLKPPGLFSLFSAVVTGDDGLPSKPAPDVFLRGAKLMGVDIGRCAVLEDSWNGLRAGRAAGAVTVMVPDLVPYGPEIAPCCDFVATSLREAEALLCP